METILGARIRELRRQIGLTQAEMARRMDISASYLNLIERNKRRIAGPLLVRISEILNVSLEDLDGASERRLAETLREVGSLPALSGAEIEAATEGELIGRFPGWARAIAALARSEQTAQQTSRALSDRLTHDPFLGEAVHGMLTRVSAIRSAAEILTEFDDIDHGQRARFHRIINEESKVLTDVGEALATYFDKAQDQVTTLTPLDEVEALFDARDNHFAEIEAAADEISLSGQWEHPEGRLNQASAIAKERLSACIRDLIAGQREIETDAARTRARAALTDYAARALLMPLKRFTKQAEEAGFDMDSLAQSLGVTHRDVCHRLTALKAGSGKPRFGYIQANAAGTIVELRGLPGLNLPRFAGACPLWVLFRAQQTPEVVVRQRAIFPTGAQFTFAARARNTGEAGFQQPRQYLTDMLTMTEADAQHTVYTPDKGTPLEQVGPSCRLCPRTSCTHRVADPLVG